MSKSHFDRIGVKNKMARACELAQVRLSSAVLSDSNRFIPMDTGVLKASGRIENQNKHVSWNTPYSHRVYNLAESSIKTQKNPNAKPKWFEWAKGLNMKGWMEIVQKTIMGAF
ncbi:MAG: minor capsid protein [Alphaproteobacteria bacterium]|nr:minor capsid protein [Alphaproteobacteria bacterium]